MKFLRTGLVALALAGIAFGEERHYVWSGLTIHDGKKIGRAVSTFGEALAKKARADAHAASFRKEIAQVRVSIDVDGKLEDASKKLEDIHVRASWALDYDGRMDVLVEIAKLRSELFTSLGRKDEALAAASVLFLDESARKAAAGYETIPADDAALAQEKTALADEGLALLRQKLSARSVADPHAAPTDEISSAVESALAGRDPQVVRDIGPRAVPTLERIVLANPDALPADFNQDPLGILFDLARVRGGRLALDHFDAGGFFWKKRVLRAMSKFSVFNDSATIDPVWIALLEKLLGDPEVSREALPLVEPVATRDALTAKMREELVHMLDSNDPDLARDVLNPLAYGSGKESAKPVYESLLQHRTEFVRHDAAFRMMEYRSSDAFVACVDHVDAEMRKQLAQFLRPRQRQVGSTFKSLQPTIGPDERKALTRLASDPDPTVRKEAAISIRELKDPLEPEVYERMAVEKDEQVLLEVDRTFVQLASRSSIEPWLLSALEKRRENRAYPMTKSLGKDGRDQLCSSLLQTAAGTRLLFRWALDEPDDELLVSATSRMKVQPDQMLNSAAQASTADTKGVFALDDPTLERIYRRSYALSKQDSSGSSQVAFGHLNEGLGNNYWGKQARVGSVMPVLADAEAPRELRAAAAAIVAFRVNDSVVDAVVDGIEKLLDDSSWSNTAPTPLELRWIQDIAQSMPDPGRARVASFAVQSKEISDSGALLFLSGYHDKTYPPEIAKASLVRWFADPRPNDATELEWPRGRVLSLALTALPSQPPDETVSKLVIRAAEDPNLASYALGKIAEMRWPAFLDVLGEHVRKCDLRALPALAAYMDDRAAELLIQAMGSCPNDDFRRACLANLDAIRKYQDEKAHWASRKNGQQARDEAVAKLLPMLADADEKIRAQAVLSLATLDAVEHLPKIVEMLKDKSSGVRDAAAKALEKLNGLGAKKP